MKTIDQIINNKMAETIITTSIPSDKFAEVRKYFSHCLSESIGALDSDDFESLEWYENCNLDDYFTEKQELWSDMGEYLGEGFDMIFAKIILNDDTRDDLENMFEQARDNEYESALEDFASHVWEEVKDYTPYNEDDPRSSNFDEWCQNGEMNSRFDDVDGVHIYKIFTNSEKKTAINVIFADDKIYRY